MLGAIVYWRRRSPAERVEVTFDDGSSVRLQGREAAVLLDDARRALRALAP